MKTLSIYPDSIVKDVSNHTIGINLDYFMDGDRYPHAQHTTIEALKAMGVNICDTPAVINQI
jgi:alpha-N-arabinofuranosidase